MTFLTVLGVTEILCFRLIIEGKTSKEISESSRLEFLYEFLEGYFDLSDAEDNTYGPLNRGGIEEVLVICQSRQATFLGSDGLFSFLQIW